MKVKLVVLSACFAVLCAEVLLRLGIPPNNPHRDRVRRTAFKKIKQKHETIVAIIGDSVVTDHRYEQDLSKAVGLDFHVVSLASGGKGVPYYWSAVNRYLPTLKPDLLILAYHVGNDLSDTMYKLDRLPKKPPIWLKPFYSYRVLQDKLTAIRFNARYRRLERLVASAKSEGITASNSWLIELSKDHPRHLMDNLLIDSVEAKRAWEVNQEYLSQIAELCNRQGTKLFLYLVPRSVQINRAAYDRWSRMGFAVDDEFLNTEVPQELMKKFCVQKKMECFDLLPHFRRSSRKRYYFEYNDRSSLEGYRFVLSLLAKEIKKRNLLQPGESEP